MGSLPMAIAESAASAQRLRREAEKGIRFRRSAGRLLQARRVARGMNIGKFISQIYLLFLTSTRFLLVLVFLY